MSGLREPSSQFGLEFRLLSACFFASCLKYLNAFSTFCSVSLDNLLHARICLQSDRPNILAFPSSFEKHVLCLDLEQVDLKRQDRAAIFDCELS